MLQHGTGLSIVAKASRKNGCNQDPEFVANTEYPIYCIAKRGGTVKACYSNLKGAIKLFKLVGGSKNEWTSRHTARAEHKEPTSGLYHELDTTTRLWQVFS